MIDVKDENFSDNQYLPDDDVFLSRNLGTLS